MKKKNIIILFVTILFLSYLFRLFWIQIIDESYKISADNNAIRHIIQYPSRGLIFDRNNKLLVYNEASYDLMVIPKQLRSFDTLEFCNILNIEKKVLIKKLKKAKRYSRYKAYLFLKQISKVNYAILQEKLHKFPGFFVELRTLRKHTTKSASHVLGYIGEVTNKNIKKDNYYKSGNYIGQSGLEKYYEKNLRGKKGIKRMLVDVHNRIQGSYKNGKYDTIAVSGDNLKTTIDIDLQIYGEDLMKNKIGSIVVIIPKTGEILSLISSPSYDPNLLFGRKRAKNYNILSRDSLQPLFNRALMAKYPPGSIFKIVQALIALQEKVATPYTSIACNKSLLGCHNHPQATTIEKSIQYSCNPYYYKIFQRIIQRGKETNIYKDSRIGLLRWHECVTKFGFGKKLKIDLPSIKAGFIPNVDYYDKIYNGKYTWAFSTIYSLGIGQGEIQVIPLQMANLASIIANKGFYYTPHLIKNINKENFKIKNFVGIDGDYFKYIINGMEAVVNKDGGTARRARLKDIIICGKTGTAENPHGEDHSVFIAFAPKENPQIAIAVYVENSGYGGTWAAPIASLMIEKYLKDSITNTFREKRILESNLLAK